MTNPFTTHPQSVGESYLEHLASASSFAAWMIVGAVACLVHALLPFAFTRSASAIIRRLHDRMVVRRAR